MITFEINKGGSRLLKNSVLAKLGRVAGRKFKKRGTISVAFIKSGTIGALNKKYRRKDRATDVLTFVFDEEACLGEIVLSEREIKERAKLMGWNAEKTAVFLVIHGLLHIFGFDHKIEKDALKMEKKEKEIMEEVIGNVK